MDLVATLRLEVAGFLAGSKEAQAALAETQNKVITLGDLLDKAPKQWAAFGDSLQSFGARSTVVGGIITGALTIPLEELAKASIDMGSRFQQAAIALETMTGSAMRAQQFLESLKEFAATTPFQFPDLLETAQRMTALGFSAEAVIPMLRTIGDAMGALGRGQEGINGVTQAFGRMLERGIVSAREMNMLATQGIASWKILAESLGISIPELMTKVRNRAVEAVNAIPALLEGMNAQFEGQMKRQMDTFAGQWSNFKERLSYVFGDLGAILLPFAKTFAQWGIEALAVIDDLIKKFGELPTALQAVGLGFGVILAAAGPLIAIFGTLTGLFGFAVKGASELALAFGYKSLTAAISAATASLAELAPVLAAVGAAAAGVIAIWALWDVEPVRNTVLGLWEALQGFWSETLKPLGEELAALALAFVDLASDIAGSTLSELWAYLVELGKDLMTGLDGLSGVLEELSSVWDDLVKSVAPLKEPLMEVWDAFSKILEVIGEGAWWLLVGAIKGLALIMEVLVREALKDLVEGLKNLVELLHTVSDVVYTVSNKFTEWDKAVRNMPNIWTLLGLEKVNDAFGETATKVDTASGALEKARETVTRWGQDTRSAMAIAKTELDDAQKAYDALLASSKKGKDVNDELSIATERLARAHQGYREELNALQPEITAAVNAVKESDAAVITAEKGVKAATAAMINQTGSAAQLADANAKLKAATEASSAAHENLKRVTAETGIAYNTFDQGLKTVRESLQTHTAHVETAAEAQKRLAAEIAEAKKGVVAAWEAYRTGVGDIDAVRAALENLTLTSEKQHPEEAAKARIKTLDDEKKAAEALLAWEENTYTPKMMEFDRQEEASKLKLQIATAKVTEAIREGALEQIKIRRTLSERIIDYNNYDQTMTIQAAVDTAERVANAYEYLGIKTAASLDQTAENATKAYNEIATNANASYGEILQAEREMLEASINQWIVWGNEVPAEAKKRLKEINDALQTSLSDQKGFWDKFWSEIKRSADNFGRDLAKSLWQAMFGDSRNDELDKQAEELRASLADRTKEWEAYQVEVAQKLSGITAAHAAHLAQVLADLQSSLDDATAAWLQYQRDAQAGLNEFTADQDAKLIAEVEKLNASLAERAAAWQKYQEDVQIGLNEFTAKQDAELQKQKASLLADLEDRRAAWIEYQNDAAAKLAEFTAAQDEKLAQQLQGYREDLEKRAQTEAAYRADALSKLEDFRAKQKEKLDKDIADLARNLEEKRQSYESYVADVQEKLLDLREASEEKTAAEIEKLKETLSEKKKAYEEYVTDVNKKLNRIGEDLKEQIEDETRSTQRGIEDKKTAFARAERDTNEKIEREVAKGAKANQDQINDWRRALEEKRADLETYLRRAQEDLAEFTEDHQRTADRQTADLKDELDKRRLAQEELQRQTEASINDVTEAAKAQLEKQTADLQKSLADRTREWQKFQEETARKVGEAQSTYTKAIADQEKATAASLASRQQAWNEYQADINKKIIDAQLAHDKAIDAEVKKTIDGLNAKRIEWEKYQATIAAKIEEAQKKHDDAIAAEVKKVTEGLAAKLAEWEKYQASIAAQIAAAQKKHDDAITAETEKVLADLEKRRKAYEAYIEEVRKKMEQARIDEAAAQEKEVLALQKQLNDKLKEYEKYVNDTNKRLAELADEHVTFWEKVGAAGVKAVETIWGALISLGIKEFFSWLNDQGIFDGLKSAARALWDHLKGGFDGAWELIKGGFTKFADWIWDGIKAIGSGIAGIFTNSASAASSTVGSVGGAIGQAGGAAGQAGGIAGSIASGISTGVTGVVSAIASSVTAITGVLSFIQGMHQSTDLGRIEENTRFTQIALIGTGGVLDRLNTYLPGVKDIHDFDYNVLAPILADISSTLVDKLNDIYRGLVVDIKNITIDIKDISHDAYLKLLDFERTFAEMNQRLYEIAAGIGTMEAAFGESRSNSSSSGRDSRLTVEVTDLDNLLEDVSDKTRTVAVEVDRVQGTLERVFDAMRDVSLSSRDSYSELRNVVSKIERLSERVEASTDNARESTRMLAQANLSSFQNYFSNMDDTLRSIANLVSTQSSTLVEIPNSLQQLGFQLQNMFAGLNLGATLGNSLLGLERAFATYDSRAILTSGFGNVTAAIYSLQATINAGQSAQLNALYSMNAASKAPTSAPVTINVNNTTQTAAMSSALASALRSMGIPV